MERLDKEEKAEHEGEGNIEIIAEDGKCKEGFGDKEPQSIIQSLDFPDIGRLTHAKTVELTSTSAGRKGPKNIC